MPSKQIFLPFEKDISSNSSRIWLCKSSCQWLPPGMSQDLRERGRWLARNVLPHEALLRAKLGGMCLYDLDIEDVIQEMYARFMTHPSLDSIRYPRQYALLTARGIIIDHVRHSRVVSITSSGNLEMLEIPAPDINTEERIEFQQEINVVMAALDQLPKTCRETLVLRRVEGLPQREVARRLNISEKTVEKHMATGVRLLIKVFGRGGKVRANSTTIHEVDGSEDVAKKPAD